MTGFNRAELVSVIDEHPDIFANALKRRVEKWEAPLNFQITVTDDGAVDLGTIPAFREWLGALAIKASVHGVGAFIDTLMEIQSQPTDVQNDSDLVALEHRIKILEWRLSQILPPEWSGNDPNGDSRN